MIKISNILILLFRKTMGFYRLFFTMFFLTVIIDANTKFNKDQIVIMLDEFFNAEVGETLLGYRFYEIKKNTIIQLEIKQNDKNPNSSLLFGFKAMSLVTNISQKEFNLGILVMHSESRITPIVAQTDLVCAQSFFLEKEIGEKNGEKTV